MSSAYVVCCIFLQTFQTYILHIGKQCGPSSDCSWRSSLIWVHTVCNNEFLSNRQKTKQMTIVMIGALRVNGEQRPRWYLCMHRMIWICSFCECLKALLAWRVPFAILGYSQCSEKRFLFVCVEVLRPSQPNWVMSSAVSLPNHTFTGQA